MQGPDPSLAYRPNLEGNESKQKDYRNFEVSIQSLIRHLFMPLLILARGANSEMTTTPVTYYSHGSLTVNAEILFATYVKSL